MLHEPVSPMSTHQSASLPVGARDGLIAEAVRRALAMPHFTAVDPAELQRCLVERFEGGTTTMYGLLRSLRDGP